MLKNMFQTNNEALGEAGLSPLLDEALALSYKSLTLHTKLCLTQ